MDNQAEKPKGKKWYFRWWAWCLWALLIIFILAAVSGDSDSASSTGSSNNEKQTETSIEAIKVTSTELSSEYKANEVAADAKYKGKLVELTGTVEDIGKDISDKAYVTFALGQYDIVNKVQCYFDKRDEGQLLEISQDERITLRGTVEGGSFNVIVRKCQVVQ